MINADIREIGMAASLAERSGQCDYWRFEWPISDEVDLIALPPAKNYGITSLPAAIF
jgi:hypothetical protein